MLQNTFKNPWLALSIGNSRLHWALFVDQTLLQTWDCAHLELANLQDFRPQTWTEWQTLFPDALRQSIRQSIPEKCVPELWLLSVVPAQATVWQSYPKLNVLHLSNIPLQDTYPTLGIDRAIALWGAGLTYGWPCLVIDAGTALTFTGADARGHFVGGAILPGLRLQFNALAKSTADLPLIELPDDLPELWATETAIALQSGIIQTVIAGISHRITQWRLRYPDSPVVLTGGDASRLGTYCDRWVDQYGDRPSFALGKGINLRLDLDLIFKGIQAIRAQKCIKKTEHSP